MVLLVDCVSFPVSSSTANPTLLDRMLWGSFAVGPSCGAAFRSLPDEAPVTAGRDREVCGRGFFQLFSF